MTDREKLELAAKALGNDAQYVCTMFNATDNKCESYGFLVAGKHWNPLTDQADSDRMAAQRSRYAALKASAMTKMLGFGGFMWADLIKRYVDCLPKPWLFIHKSKHGKHSGGSIRKFQVVGNKVTTFKGETAPPRENEFGAIEFAIDEMLTVKGNFFHAKRFIDHRDETFSRSGEPPQRRRECTGGNKNPCWNWNWLKRGKPSDYGCNDGKYHAGDHVGNKVLALTDKEIAHRKPNY